MAYVILVNEDNSLYGSKKERVMQRSKLVDSLVFVVDSTYKGIDMTNATVMLEYILPVSREYKTVILTLSDERYNDCYLQYKLPFDVDLTSQAGFLEIQLTFAYSEMDESGKIIQRVRKTDATKIDVIPIAKWSDIIPDSVLGGLDQRLIVMNAQIQALDDYMNVVNTNKADNLVYDDKNETLQLSANGKVIGNKVSVRDMLDDGIPVIDLDSDSGNNSEKDDCDCGCDCDDENNVVEFGDIVVEKPNKNDDGNVVEF